MGRGCRRRGAAGLWRRCGRAHDGGGDGEAGGWACGDMERRCAGTVVATGLAGGEMGEDLLDAVTCLQSEPRASGTSRSARDPARHGSGRRGAARRRPRRLRVGCGRRFRAIWRSPHQGARSSKSAGRRSAAARHRRPCVRPIARPALRSPHPHRCSPSARRRSAATPTPCSQAR